VHVRREGAEFLLHLHALGVEHLTYCACAQRPCEKELHQQRLAARHGRRAFAEPGIERGPPRLGGLVELAVGAGSLCDALVLHQASRLQVRQRPVDRRLVSAPEVPHRGVEGALQIVAAHGAEREEAENGVAKGHGGGLRGFLMLCARASI